MRIGDLSRETRASIRSLRYYEAQGLITADRTLGGQRVYCDAMINRVHVIRRLLAAGLPSRAIRVLLPCEDTGAVTADMVEEIQHQHARLGARIDELNTAKKQLDEILTSVQDEIDAY